MAEQHSVGFPHLTFMIVCCSSIVNCQVCMCEFWYSQIGLTLVMGLSSQSGGVLW